MNFWTPTATGASSAYTTPSLFSTGTTTAPQTFMQAQQAQQPPQETLASNYSELPAARQQQLESCQALLRIRNQREDVEAHSLNRPSVEKARDELGVLGEKLRRLSNVMETEYTGIIAFKKEVTLEMHHTERAMRAVERLKAGAFAWQQNPSLPSAYFLALLEQFEKRMQQYRLLIEEIERNLSSVTDRKPYTPAMLQEIMRNQYELFMALAAQVGALHEHVADLKEQYLRLRPAEPNFFQEAEKRAAANTLRNVGMSLKIPPPPAPQVGAVQKQSTTTTAPTGAPTGSLFTMPMGTGTGTGAGTASTAFTFAPIGSGTATGAGLAAGTSNLFSGIGGTTASTGLPGIGTSSTAAPAFSFNPGATTAFTGLGTGTGAFTMPGTTQQAAAGTQQQRPRNPLAK